MATDEDFTAIAFCPLCCTSVDVEGTGEQELECVNCGQVWIMVIDPERIARHSIH